ncbi:hypothetical protein ASC83_17565 [Acidovorax sp. Root402]|nr:hypothetical protein ASC83_17565 [Acidovorax sp. Root402]
MARQPLTSRIQQAIGGVRLAIRLVEREKPSETQQSPRTGEVGALQDAPEVVTTSSGVIITKTMTQCVGLNVPIVGLL